MLTDAYEFWEQGGWPMIPLALCSIAALTIVIERAIALRRARIINYHVEDLLETFQGEVSVEPLLMACRRFGGSLAHVIEDLLRARKQDHAHLVDILNATGRREVGHLERGLVVLEIVAGVSPLIGLLGTVLGMVTVFDAITAEGIGNPQVLSEGISEALITTVAGLCVAIPALAFHGVYMRRVDSLAVEIQDIATTFISRLRLTMTPPSASRPRPVAPPAPMPPPSRDPRGESQSLPT